MDQPPMNAELFRIGEWTVEPSLNRLADGRVNVHLEPRVMATLVHLARRGGEVVSKDELLRAIWPNVIVEEASVARCISDLRRAFGENAGESRYIETIPKKGYRLVATVMPLERHRTARWYFLAASIVALVAIFGALWWRPAGKRVTRMPQGAAVHSIAVIPLRSIPGDSSENFFADGMTEALTAELARLRSIRVISSDSLLLRNGGHPSKAAALRKLDADAFLDGSVLRSGDEVRITLRLTAPDGSVRWSRNYTRLLRDVLELQQEIASEVSGELRSVVGERVRAAIRPPREVDTEAYIDYLKGRAEWQRRTPESIRKGRSLLEKAITRSPDFALAHADLANCLVLMANYGLADPATVLSLARIEAKRALSLDPDLAEAHVAVAVVLEAADWNMAASCLEMQRAIELEPGNATFRMWNAQALVLLARLQEGIREADVAMQLDPLSPWIHNAFAESLRYAGRYERALRLKRAAAAMSPEHEREAIYFEGLVRAQQGRYDEAVDAFARALPPDLAKPLRSEYVSLGFEEAMRRKERRQLESIVKNASMSEPNRVIAATYCHLRAGDVEESIEGLERMRKLRVSDFPDHLGNIALEPWPMLQRVKADPRFDRLLKETGLPSWSVFREAVLRAQHAHDRD